MKSHIEGVQQAQLLFHRLIVLDLCIRTLELDVRRLDGLKMSRPIVRWYEQQIDNMQLERKEKRKELGRIGAKGELKSEKEGEDMQAYTLIYRGQSHVLKYFNIVLRNHVENELLKRLGLEYIKSPYEDE